MLLVGNEFVLAGIRNSLVTLLVANSAHLLRIIHELIKQALTEPLNRGIVSLFLIPKYKAHTMRAEILSYSKILDRNFSY